MHELDGQQHLRGAVSMSARASLVRACTRSSGAASPARCSIRSSTSSSAAFPASSVGQLQRVVVARNVDERERLVGAAQGPRNWSMGPALVFDIRVAIAPVVERL